MEHLRLCVEVQSDPGIRSQLSGGRGVSFAAQST